VDDPHVPRQGSPSKSGGGGAFVDDGQGGEVCVLNLAPVKTFRKEKRIPDVPTNVLHVFKPWPLSYPIPTPLSLLTQQIYLGNPRLSRFMS
jgi:hypothetical protein